MVERPAGPPEIPLGRVHRGVPQGEEGEECSMVEILGSRNKAAAGTDDEAFLVKGKKLSPPRLTVLCDDASAKPTGSEPSPYTQKTASETRVMFVAPQGLPLPLPHTPTEVDSDILSAVKKALKGSG
ncbi:uncharacterized protein N7479_006538 [Penicillium vulpinum]|uniref:uncharacterized protein n=1 Tax=Penicillium vulpinum TaxID=29845 RepID=UPI0025491E8C|nr:uncharacterized protein N7479_006538 [Penicillium vulpinum]KAJ5959388.1 hypothetical protein N7479_006538 [Penicillium vulpinum]